MSWFGSETAVALAWFATAVSLLVGVFGFRLTLKQIAQVQTSAQAAEKAISNLKVRLNHFDAIHECATAENALAELKSCAQEMNALAGLRLSDRLASSLLNLLEQLPSLEEQTRAELEDAVQNSGKLAGLFSSGGNEELQKIYFALRNIERIIVKIRVGVQREQL